MKTRMYFLVNQYMMGIQAGIQAGHAACRLMAEYLAEDPSNPKVQLVNKWCRQDETFILLDGGYQSRMDDFVNNVLLPVCDRYPYTKFHEEPDSLNGALTAVAFILPESIYAAKLDENGEAPDFYMGSDLEYVDYSWGEKNLIKELKSFHLKRG